MDPEQQAEYLFQQFVAPRLDATRIALESDEARRASTELLEAAREVRRTMVGSSSESLGSPQFDGRVRELASRLHGGIRLNESILRDGGFLDALDTFPEQLNDLVSFETLPQIDFELIAAAGSPDARAELYLLVRHTKRALESPSFIVSRFREISARGYFPLAMSSGLRRASKVTAQMPTQTSNDNPAIRRDEKRSWLKGLGKIAQGGLLSLGNVGAAAAGVVLWPQLAPFVAANPIASAGLAIGLLTSLATGVNALCEGADAIW